MKRSADESTPLSHIVVVDEKGERTQVIELPTGVKETLGNRGISSRRQKRVLVIRPRGNRPVLRRATSVQKSFLSQREKRKRNSSPGQG